MELLSREEYTRKISGWIGKEIIIVLTGQRRVGKSMCLRLMAEQACQQGANVIYIDKEDAEMDSIATYQDLNAFIDAHFQNNKHNFILIDEVQDIKGFERSLRSWIKKGDTDIIITGSNAKMLSGDLSTQLSARYIEIPIHSLSYLEFLAFHNLANSDESLQKYLAWGGLPYLRNLSFDDTDKIKDYLNSVYNTVVLKDIIQREQIRNVPFLMNLGKFMSDNIGKLMSPNSIMNYMRSQGEKLSAPLILNYLTFYCNSYLAYRVFRYDVHGKQLMENNEKYYFEDLGIRNVLIRSTDSNDIEKRIENVVYMHLVRNGFTVRVGQLNGKEIDFVAERGDETLYVQASYLIANEETEKREFGNLLSIKDNHLKMVVSMNPLNTNSNYQGVRHLHLREFLVNAL